MAYFNQKDKATVAPKIKEVFKKYGVKGSIGVKHHSTLVINIKEGKLDFIGADKKVQEYQSSRTGRDQVYDRDYIQVNRYYAEEWHRSVGENKIASFFKELNQAALGAGWYDNSDIQIDYFDTAYYIDINIGKWNQPYRLV